jgi:hypothetical protein
MTTTFAVGKADGKATEVRIVEEEHRSARAGGDGHRSFARSAARSDPFPGPWTLKAIIRSPRKTTSGSDL